jgi:dTDP-4-dehydrorhamnose reductase
MIWIIGNQGMLGQELFRLLEEKQLNFIGSDREVDILDQDALSAFSDANTPDCIINCSAFTAVDRAEDESEAAYAINHQGVENIAKLAAERGIPLIHISTDYVFDGTSQSPLDESAPTSPQSVYGSSKLAGEEAIRKHNPRHMIIRTAWLYGEFGPNFVYTMLKLMNSHESIKVVNDQIGSPTWARDLAGLIRRILSSGTDNYGTYHFSGEGECSWYDFAREIYRIGREKGLIDSQCTIEPCSSDEFPAKAPRPAYSLLSKEKVKRVFHYQPQHWQHSLEQFLHSISTKEEE